MNNYSFTKNNVTYKRVNKAAARAAYNRGETVYIMPVNANPHFIGFSYPFDINTADPAGDEYRTTAAVLAEFKKTMPAGEFDSRINEFEFYNCNSELGNYSAYYIAVA